MVGDDDQISIHIDREVWEALQAEAEPFIDTPNTVLRRKLRLTDVSAETPPERAPHGRSSRRRRRSAASMNGTRPRRPRAPRGSLLPEAEYELPILEVLNRHGGRVPAREVIGEVGEIIGDRLTELDHEELHTGGRRWEKRVQFTRLRLVERGLVAKDSPRGVWEITDDGRRALTAGTTSV
jgi:Mrr N-terminal domain